MASSLNKTAISIGNHAAERLFEARRRPGRKPEDQAEIHITKADLALAMAVCAQAAWDTCMSAVQRVHEQTDREISMKSRP